MPRYAAIDIGSNSARMLAADVDSKGKIAQLAIDRQVTRLGESVFNHGIISEEAMTFVCGVLARMAATYRRLEIKTVRAVATAAVRDASNQAIFIERAAEAIGSPVEIVSGQEEARLIHLGVQSCWPHSHQRVLIIDIGGGSAELIVGENGRFREAYSKPLGAVRLTGMFFKEDPPAPRELTALNSYIAQRLDAAARKFGRLKFDRVIATSSSASAVVSAVNRIPRARRDEADRRRASASQIGKLYHQLSTLDLDARRRVTGIGPRRAEIIVPGAAVFHQILTLLRLPSLYHSAVGVREGIIADLFARRAGSELSQLSTEQRRIVEQAANRFGVDPKHTNKIATLSNTLFEALQPLHKLPPESGKLLEAAAYLYDTGHYISDTGHHKHSEYIVANAELPTFTARERGIVATLCRFHRKSMPGARHLNFQALPADDRHTALHLIPLLRLADALDRGKAQRVNKLECEIRNGDVVLKIDARQGMDLEYWASERVAEIFQDVYGRTLKVSAR